MDTGRLTSGLGRSNLRWDQPRCGSDRPTLGRHRPRWPDAGPHLTNKARARPPGFDPNLGRAFPMIDRSWPIWALEGQLLPTPDGPISADSAPVLARIHSKLVRFWACVAELGRSRTWSTSGQIWPTSDQIVASRLRFRREPAQAACVYEEADVEFPSRSAGAPLEPSLKYVSYRQLPCPTSVELNPVSVERNARLRRHLGRATELRRAANRAQPGRTIPEKLIDVTLDLVEPGPIWRSAHRPGRFRASVGPKSANLGPKLNEFD